MSLDGVNFFQKASEIIHNGVSLDEKEIAKRKGIYLEGLIRFLDIYSQIEIGEGIELDITKIALFINSPRFENDDLYEIESIEDVYCLFESLTLAGLPIWRFLKLTEYQSNLFEKGYEESLIKAKIKAGEEKPCYRCIWYDEFETDFGIVKKCKKPRIDHFKLSREYDYDPNEIETCEWTTTLTSIPQKLEELNKEKSRLINSRKFLESVESARKRFEKKLLEDPFRIPKKLEESEAVSLEREYDYLLDFSRAVKNKKGYSDLKEELRKAMYLEGMIRFFEIYAKMEIGNNYIADITNISIYVDSLYKEDIAYIKSYEDVYLNLEEKIINGFEVIKFVKLKSD